jgi:hypothetical protein
VQEWELVSNPSGAYCQQTNDEYFQCNIGDSDSNGEAGSAEERSCLDACKKHGGEFCAFDVHTKGTYGNRCCQSIKKCDAKERVTTSDERHYRIYKVPTTVSINDGTTKDPVKVDTFSKQCHPSLCQTWSCHDEKEAGSWCDCYEDGVDYPLCPDNDDEPCDCSQKAQREWRGVPAHPKHSGPVCGDSGIITGTNSKPIIKKETVPGQGGGTTDVGRWESTDPTLGGRMGQSWDTKHASMTPSDQTFYYDTRPTRPFQASFELHQECTTHQGGMKQTFKLNPEQEYTLKFDCCTTSSWPTRTVFVSMDGMYTRHLIQCNKVSGGKCERKELTFTSEKHWNNEQVDAKIVFFSGKNECVFIDDIVLETCQ